MKRCAWLGPFLLAGALTADPPVFVMATAAGYIPGATPIALQQLLTQPVVVAYDPYGNLYYGTTHQVWQLNPDGTETLVAGTGTVGWVSGLAIDAQQNVYISDPFAAEIFKVTPAGVATRFAGTGAPPSYGASSNAGASTPAQKVALNPGALAIDTANLYVSDSATSSVLSFTLDGKSSKVVAGNHGLQSAGDGGLAVNASLFYPGNLALGNGTLYINEAGGARIRQVIFRSGVISTLVQLAQTFLNDNGNEGLAAGADGTVYVQSGNTIARIYPNTSTPQPWAGGGSANPGDPGPALQATLLNPLSLATNPVTNDLALADFAGNLVQTVSGSTGAIQTVAGTVHFAGDNGPAAMALFNGLESVVADSQGNLYVADTGNHRIRKIDTNGIVTTIAGTGINGFSGDGGPATSASLSLQHTARFGNNLTIDSAGNLYVSDYGNGRIRKIDTTGVITTVAGGGHTPLILGAKATTAALEPGPLAVDSKGNIYFGNVYILASPMIPTVYKIDATGQLSAIAGGSGILSDSGPALNTLIGYAYCLVADSQDNLYVCDSTYNRVRKISPNGMMTTVAGNGSVPNGTIPAGPPTGTAIGSPTALAVDSTGDLFIYSLGQVTEINGSPSAPLTLQPVAGSNTMPMVSSGDGAWASQATFASIGGMARDPSGNLYLSDGGLYVRELMPVGSNGPPPIIIAGGIVGAGASNPPVPAVSPGAMASIFGSFFSQPGAQRLLQSSDILSGLLPTNLGGICVTMGGVNASVTGVFPNQINVQVPALPPGAVTVKVTSNCGGSSPVAGNVSAVAVGTASPEFFSTPDPVSGRSYIAAITTGNIVEAYGTGWGAASPSIPPGAIPGMAAQLVAPPDLMLGDLAVPAANILYAGVSPCCAGLYQVDFTIPTGAPSGDLPLVITVNGIASPPNAYITVQPAQ